MGGYIGNEGLKAVLPKTQEIFSINLPKESHKRRSTYFGDGRMLPIVSGKFKLVTAIDVLQQINPPDRLQFLSELVRVSSDTAVVSVPIGTKDNIIYSNDLIRRMIDVGLEPKPGIFKQRHIGDPTLDELVKLGRKLKLVFSLHPSTVASTLFQSMNDQIAVFDELRDDPSGEIIARNIWKNAEENLRKSPLPSWEEAYRAIMVIRKSHPGILIADENALFLTDNERMGYQAALRAAGWGHVPDEKVLSFYKENPLRGRNIVIEGPEGSGKTRLVKTIADRLLSKGYNTAIQTDHGLRQSIRDMEKKMNRVISDPERAEFFAFAMIQASIAGNAFSLLGPNMLSINDRGVESVRMHHGWHCPDNVTIPYLLDENPPLQIPPDLTIILRVPDEKRNFQLMQKDGDVVNKTKGPDALKYQREFYENLLLQGGSRYTGQVVEIVNPGIEGTFDEVVNQVLKSIEYFTGIPTTD